MFKLKNAHFMLLTLPLALGSAYAQSNVSLSGMVDIGLYRMNNIDNVGSIQRSNIAFSGSEDLGGGLSSTFKLNSRFSPNTGQLEGYPNKPFFYGESTVGIKGAFGAIKFGRALDAFYNDNWEFDAWDYYDMIASPAWDLWAYNWPSDPQGNNGKADYGRLTNGIFYSSPNIGPFHFSVSTSPQVRPGDSNKPLAANMTFHQGMFAGELAAGRNSYGAREVFAALRANFDSFAIMGAYDNNRSGNPAGVLTPTVVAKSYTMSAEYFLGATTLKAGWGRVNVGGSTAESMASLGASYSLSKQTRIYADLARKKYPSSAQTQFGLGLAKSF